MELGQTFINVHIIQQKFIDLPFYFDKERGQLVGNAKLQHRWKMPIWHISNVLLIPFFIFSTLHLLSLQKFPTKEIAEEAVVYVFLFGMSLLALTTAVSIERDPRYLAKVATETLWAGGIKYKGFPTLKRIPQFPEMFGYASVAGFYFIPLCAAIFPLLRDYDPLSILLRDFVHLPEVPRRITAAAGFGIFVLWNTPAVSNEILLMSGTIVVFGKLLGEMEKLNLDESHQLDQGGIDWFQRLVYKILEKLRVLKGRKNITAFAQNPNELNGNHYELWHENSIITPAFRTHKVKRHRSINEKFREQLHFYNQLFIIMTAGNYSGKLFFPPFAFLGISVSVAMNYAIIMLYSELDLPLYLFAIFIDTVCIVLIIFFCYHGARPLVLSTKFIDFWKAKTMNKADMKRAKAIIPIACMLGNFFTAKNHTALDIMSTIQDYTITFIVSQ